ncbi:MAG: LTA synthase family protein [Lachnospiraceae bacterium]|nr:LTA synthase family protein [Lachnospiraceae bacterium]
MVDEKEQLTAQSEENNTENQNEETEKKPKLFAYAFTKKQLRAALIAFAVMLGFCIYGHTNILLAVVCGGVYYLIKGMTIHLPEKLNYLWLGIEFFLCSLFTVYLVQYMLLDDELRAKTTPEKLRLNVLCALTVYLIVMAIIARVSKCVMISHITLLSLAGINYFVYRFRGNEIIFSDWKSFRTGLSVATEYQFSIESHAVFAIVVSIVFVALIRKFQLQFKRKWLLRLICAGGAAVLIAVVSANSGEINTESWQQKGTYRNGFILNYALSIRDSVVEIPSGYSTAAVQDLEKRYPADAAADAASVPEDAPVIIGIMDESFADLSVIGDLELNQEFMPFINSMDKNVTKGYALASVFGAKTPNSEWEFLTGNTMAFLPNGSVVYQQYLDGEPYSIVDVLTKYGYTCKAMHPYFKSGWSRERNYPMIGFTESLFLEDFAQKNMIRNYVSDQEMFEKLIELYEAKGEDEKLFLFGVTMQNHGGYKDTYEDFETDTVMTNGNYPDVNQYLSVAHQTDVAVEKLIEYFEKVDDKVVICFFGDHQPSLQEAFYRQLNGYGLGGMELNEMQNLFKVPFFIWTNYDSAAETVDCTSLNFLSSMTLQKAGLPLPPYSQFLLDLEKEIPALNSRGYYSRTEGGFLNFASAAGEEAQWLSDYRILQYNSMFDRFNRSETFFGQYMREP